MPIDDAGSSPAGANLYAATVRMRAGRYQKSMSEVMQYAVLYRIKVGGGHSSPVTVTLPKGGDWR